MLELEEVTKHYRGPGEVVRAVRGASLAVDQGEFVAIFGPSGSGKTTLLLLAAGLLRPDSGVVRFLGRDISILSKDEQLALRRSELGFVFQNFNLVPGLNAEDNVALPLVLDGGRRRKALAVAREMLKRVGLRQRAKHEPDELSGGEKQRVAIARALVASPRLILADEPTGNLDTETGDEVLKLLSELCRDRGAAAILVTHDARAASFASQVKATRDGRLVDHETLPPRGEDISAKAPAG